MYNSGMIQTREFVQWLVWNDQRDCLWHFLTRFQSQIDLDQDWGLWTRSGGFQSTFWSSFFLLSEAVSAKNYQLVSLLLQHGASPTAGASERSTALHHAAFQGDLPVMKLLLHYGTEKGGPTYGYTEVVDEKDRTPLFIAAGQGHADIVQFLLAQGADATRTGQNEWRDGDEVERVGMWEK